MGTSLVKLISDHPIALRKALTEQARLQRVIEALEEEDDPDIDAFEETQKPDFEQSREMIKLGTKIEKCKIKVEEAEGKASEAHRAINPKATIASMTAAENSNEQVNKHRVELVDLEEQLKLLELAAKEKEWLRRHGLDLPVERSLTAREQTKLEKQVEKTRVELDKAEAEVQALASQFEGFKLLVAMGVTEI